MNFWEKMKQPLDSARGKPILCLAPMADVTDAAFRFIIAKVSKEKPEADFLAPSSKSAFGFSDTYVTYTEFVSADGLVLAPEKGRKKLLKDLEYDEIERPIVAQFFTNKPEMMEKAAALAVELGFDGVDINMGCPDKSIEKQGAGATLMKNLPLARELIKAAKLGASRGALAKWSSISKAIPVSVKTRLGYNKDELETWLPELLAENPAAIIIHARTRKEMSKVPARWERIKRAVEIRDEIQTSPLTPLLALGEGNHRSYPDNSDSSLFPSPDQGEGHTKWGVGFRTLIIGNGDVFNVEDARRKCEESGADGAMLGRAIFGNPWLFADYEPTAEERLRVLIEHTKLFEEKFAVIKNFAVMKKHFKEYLKDPELRDLRYKLMRTKSAKEAEETIKNYFQAYS
ncbi:MAG: tRNA-dihydrouridine synthase [Candidatus Zambryskibacteria bacterium]